MSRRIFWLGGAGDSRFIPAMLGGLGYEMAHVPYNNSIGPISQGDPWGDYRSNLADGEAKLAKAVRSAWDVPVVAGYSFGAYAVSNFMDRYATGYYRDLFVAGALTFGNPRRPGTGIAGSHSMWKVPYLDITAPDDVISNCPPGSALRRIPHFVEAVTGLDPSRNRLDVVRAMSLVMTGVYANYWGLGAREIELCWKYLDGSGHGTDYFKGSHRSKAKGFLDGI